MSKNHKNDNDPVRRMQQEGIYGHNAGTEDVTQVTAAEPAGNTGRQSSKQAVQPVLLEASDVRQYFTVKKARGKKAVLKAVDGVSLSVSLGETFGLVGESGCGKSTLGKTILKLYPATGGKILFDGMDISTLGGRSLLDFRRQTQMIFQDPSSCLNPRRRVRDILAEPYIIHKMYSSAERMEKVEELCDKTGLSKVYLDRYPHEMSGGQKQRVGIARALALDPRLIVCDEPVSALDVSIQAQVINLLQDLQEQFHFTYFFISHNLSVVKHCCQRIGVMYLGRIMELASSDSIYHSALHPYTKALISAIPTVDNERPVRTELRGDLPSPINPPAGCPFHTRCPDVMDICKTSRPDLSEAGPDHYVACHLYGGQH